jgi:hypothetical protein
MALVISTKTSHLINGFSLPYGEAVEVSDTDVSSYLALDGVIEAPSEPKAVESKEDLITEIHELENKVSNL